MKDKASTQDQNLQVENPLEQNEELPKKVDSKIDCDIYFDGRHLYSQAK